MAKMLRLKQVLEIIPVKKSTIYKWIQEGKFPEPLRPSSRCSLWSSDSVEQFMNNAF